MEKSSEKSETTKGLKIPGLIEETKRLHEENKGSPKMMYHESSLKAPTRISKRKYIFDSYNRRKTWFWTF